MRGSRHHRAHVHIHNGLQTGATQRAGLRLAQHNFGNFSFTALIGVSSCTVFSVSCRSLSFPVNKVLARLPAPLK
jgi:hypothetical protein